MAREIVEKSPQRQSLLRSASRKARAGCFAIRWLKAMLCMCFSSWMSLTGCYLVTFFWRFDSLVVESLISKLSKHRAIGASKEILLRCLPSKNQQLLRSKHPMPSSFLRRPTVKLFDSEDHFEGPKKLKMKQRPSFDRLPQQRRFNQIGKPKKDNLSYNNIYVDVRKCQCTNMKSLPSDPPPHQKKNSK